MLTILINPTIVTLKHTKVQDRSYPYHTGYMEISALDDNSNELARFTIVPISESELKLFMEDKKSGYLYESVTNKTDYQSIEEPMQIMLNRVNLTLS